MFGYTIKLQDARHIKYLRLANQAQLEELMNGKKCVQIIGKLVLASFREGYFLEKNHSCVAAVSSDHRMVLFGKFQLSYFLTIISKSKFKS